MRRIVTSLICAGLIAITCVHAEENRWCPADDDLGNAPTTRIATWRAGTITAGKPTPLGVAYDSSDPKCVGVPCLALGGVSGVELREAGSSVCVGVPGKGKLATMFGWIPASRWRLAEGSVLPAVRWVGVWQNETAKITVQMLGDGQLDIKGHAVREINNEQEHYGDFAIKGNPLGGTVTGKGDSESCEISVRLVGDYLAVADNEGCGGFGVSFTGIYRLRHH
jgi:hypothetical protein